MKSGTPGGGKLKRGQQWLVVFVATIAITSCTEQGVQEEDIALMAQLECQARQLKEERFQVANMLRLRADSLMNANSVLTARQKAEEDSLKETLTVRTGELATRLTYVMDSLFDVRYKTVAQREVFDEALARKVEEVCK